MFEAAPTATGNPSVIDLAAAGQLPSARATQAFDVAALAFCAALSRLFLAYEGPGVEVVRALGFWLRPAGLQALQARYPQARQGIGRVFHVPPSNVPTLLVYSWLTSVLAGNDNLVRVSAVRATPLENTLLELIEAVLNAPEHAGLRARNRFLRYGHEDAITRACVAQADAVMVWGSDQTVAQLRERTLAAGRERVTTPLFLGFPARHSLLVVDGDAMRGSAGDDLEARLLERLWRDLHPFDQHSCSSPKAVVLVGDAATCLPLLQRLRAGIAHKLQQQQRSVEDWATLSVEQAVYLQSLLVEAGEALPWWRDRLLTVQLSGLEIGHLQAHPGSFCLLELHCTDYSGLAACVRLPLQTVTFWPATEAVGARIAAVLPALRRVPAGQALEFDVVWDGQDLVHALTRPDAAGGEVVPAT